EAAKKIGGCKLADLASFCQKQQAGHRLVSGSAAVSGLRHNLPCLVPVTAGTAGHAVVVLDLADGWVWVPDPNIPTSAQRWSRAEFDYRWRDREFLTIGRAQ